MKKNIKKKLLRIGRAGLSILLSACILAGVMPAVPAQAIDNMTTLVISSGISGQNARTIYIAQGNSYTFSGSEFHRNGYVIGGYCRDGGSSAEPVGRTISYCGNTTLVYQVQWVLESYTITYEMNGGANNPQNPSKYTIVSETITFKEPTRQYYTFKQWSPASIPKGSYGSRNVTAFWTPIEYNITYNLNGGVNNSNNPATYTVALGRIDLAAPSRTGYTFTGWSPSGYIAGGSHEDKTFTAGWTPTNYTISYVMNGGTNNSGNPSGYTIESGAITLQNPTRSYYTFAGWSPSNSIAAGSYGNKTFTATWTPVNYSITYYLNGGTNHSSNPASYNIESNNITLQTPTRTGYTFAGWYTNSNFTGQVTQIAKGSTGNKTLYAKWEPTRYTITYANMDGAVNASSNPSTYTMLDADVNFASPTKKGYEFLYWSTGSILSGSVGNKTTTAYWSPVTYSITYHDLNGATNPMESVATYNIETDTIVLQDVVRRGYTFHGWFSDSGYRTGVDSIPRGSCGNRDLYANLTKDTYTITYGNLTGAVNSAANPTTYQVDTPDITFEVPERTGYTFGGWYSDEDCTGGYEVTGIPVDSVGDVEIFARWDPIPYGITYENTMGAWNSSPVSYTIEDDVRLDELERDGYIFNGWAESLGSVAGAPEHDLVIPEGSYGDKKFTAFWEPVVYSVSYGDIEGISEAHGNPATYTIESDTIYLKAPEKRGYTFRGWFADEDHTLPVFSIPQGSCGHVAVYADWMINTYSISYTGMDEVLSNDNPESYNVLSGDIVLQDPVRDGYTFLGWSEDGSRPVKNIVIGSGSVGDRTLKAVWEVNPCVAVFDANGGVGSMANQEFYADDVLAIAKNGFTREGYTFAGWDLNRDASPFELRIFDMSRVRNISEKHGRTVTLYAVWVDNASFAAGEDAGDSGSKPTAAIRYDLGGGEMREEGNPSFYKNNANGAITLANPVKEGFEFAGWTGTGLDGLTMEVTIPAGAGGNRWYKAHYRGETHRVTFYTENPDGKKDLANVTFHSEDLGCDTVVSAPVPAPARDGYDFIGWSSGDERFVRGHRIYDDEYWVAGFAKKTEVSVPVTPVDQTEGTVVIGGSIRVKGVSGDIEIAVTENTVVRIIGIARDDNGKVWYRVILTDEEGNEHVGFIEEDMVVPKEKLVPSVAGPEIPGSVLPGEEKPGVVYHSVTLNYMSAAGLPLSSTVLVEEGAVISVPDPEAPQDQVFREWDNADGSAHDFSQPVTEDVTIKADYLKVHRFVSLTAPVKNGIEYNSIYMVRGQVLTLAGKKFKSNDKATVAVSGRNKNVLTAGKAGMAIVENSTGRYIVYVSAPKMAKSRIRLAVGDGRQVYLSDLDENLEVMWTSSKPTVAQVVNGYVYAVAKGSATITATVNGIAKKCKVTVTENPVNPAKIEEGMELSMYPGQKLTPVFADGSRAKGCEILKIDENLLRFYPKTGTLMALKQGRTELTLEKNGVRKTFSVDIQPRLEKKDIYVEEGASAVIRVPGVPASKIDWTVADGGETPVIATVKKNRVRGVAVGDSVLIGAYKGVIYEMNIHVYRAALRTDDNLTPALDRKGCAVANSYTLAIRPGASYVISFDSLKEELLNWKSSRKSVAIVNELGIVTAIKKGTSTITAKVGDKCISVRVVVSDEAPGTSVAEDFGYKRVQLNGGWSAFISKGGKYIYDRDDKAVKKR